MQNNATSPAPAWAAVFSLALGVFGLVGAEFLPASLLTPMARDLAVTEGMAGQAVTATAAFGLLSGLFVAAVTAAIDRRKVLLTFSGLLVLSNLAVAFAPNLFVLLIGRLVLGIALGGFWALSTATVMRLVPENSVPKALAIVVSGVSAATIMAAPVGSFVGDLLGWRAVFIGAAGLAVIVLIVQFATLPALPPRDRANIRVLVELVSRRHIAIALFAALLVFSGHMSLFTYVRPFLEQVTQLEVTGISLTLLAFGIANFLGNYFGGWLLAKSLRFTLAVMPLAIGSAAFLLAQFGGGIHAALPLIVLWGLAFGTVPVGWSAWIAQAVPDKAESVGGLLVATINLAIFLGAALGGLTIDHLGVWALFVISAGVLAVAALTVATGVGAKHRVPRTA